MKAMLRSQTLSTASFTLLFVLGGLACQQKNPVATVDAGPVPSVDVKASCDEQGTMSLCIEYGPDGVIPNEKFLKTGCTTMKGTFGTAPCSPENQVGICSITSSELRHYYKAGQSTYTVESAQHDCDIAQGKFRPTP